MMQLYIKQLSQTIKLNEIDIIGQSLTSYVHFIQPTEYFEPDDQLLFQLRQVQNSNKAYLHYLKKLKAKVFNFIYGQNYQSQLQILQKAFLGFKNQIIKSKIIKNKAKSFFQALETFHQSVKICMQNQKRAIIHYNLKIMRNMFQEFKNNSEVNKKFKKIYQVIKIELKEEFIIHLKENYKIKNRKKEQNDETNKLIKQFYEKKLMKKYFQSFLQAQKLFQLERKKKQLYLRKFIKKVKEDQLQTIQMIEKFRKKRIERIKRYIFDILYQNKVQSKVFEDYKIRVMKKYFKNWKEYHQYIINEKQIDESNKIILNHFLDLKQSEKDRKKLNICFLQWKNWVNHEKARKHQQNILKSFAEIKSKQLIQRKYFLILNENKQFEQARKYYFNKLKIKYFNGFKQYLIKESLKLQNYCNFVEKRTIKKYFDKIKSFNHNEKQKIYQFKMKKYWAQFTLNLTEGYFIKIQKAENYHSILLKFKSIIALGQNVQLNQKACYLAHYLNIILPFKQWYQQHRIIKFIRIKAMYLLKRIFFEMRCMAIRKQNRSKRITFEEKFDIKPNENKFFNLNSNSMMVSQVKQVQVNSQDNYVQQTSFFRQISSKIQQIKHHEISQSEEEQQDDEIKKKLDSLLNRIKKQKSNEIQERNFTHKRDIQKIRIPTWSTPGQQYKVSVFQDQNS